jgi:DNA invertase Pin-like site-specific DNA recombinase
MKCKKTIDARSYKHDMLEQMRRDAVKRVEAGESPEVVAAGLAINRRTIYRWLESIPLWR